MQDMSLRQRKELRGIYPASNLRQVDGIVRYQVSQLTANADASCRRVLSRAFPFVSF